MARNPRGKHDQDGNEGGLLFALGAVGGLALGVLLSKSETAAPVRQGAARLRDRVGEAATAARAWTPARLRRDEREQRSLTAVEDTVIDAFLRDEVLSERGIDVGCISRGIVELSGAVASAAESERAVRLARSLPGVDTVVNRMDVDAAEYRGRDWEGHMAGEWTGRNIGMGRRRQGDETDPAMDDSRHMREVALEQSDRALFEDEDLAHSQPRLSARPGPGAPETVYAEDEMDNQDPYGKHAVPVAEQPQALNSQSRVGEGLTPGLELALEQADVPVKPHSVDWQHGGPRDDEAAE